MNLINEDEFWMEKALAMARKAASKGEVPVAALVVGPEGLIASAINTRERQQTPLGHAEIFAVHKASQLRKSWRLQDCTLYVTLEPCLMCAGAIKESRIARVVYGASEENSGASKILRDFTAVTPGVLQEECSSTITSFFKHLRHQKGLAQKQIQVRRRASVVVLYNNKILGFHAKDPVSSAEYFFLPGGAIEGNESPAETARRECLEETGYNIIVLEETAFTKKYDFFWDGKWHRCETVFYLAELLDEWEPPKDIQDTSYHFGVDWLDATKSAETFNYNKEILWAVQKLVKTQKKLNLKIRKK